MVIEKITPFHGWAVTSKGSRGNRWVYWFTLAPTRARARENAVAAFWPDRYPTWAALAAANPNLKAIKVVLEASQ